LIQTGLIQTGLIQTGLIQTKIKPGYPVRIIRATNATGNLSFSDYSL
jgi:hypothetical protein